MSLFFRGERRSLPDQWFNIDPDRDGRRLQPDAATRLIPMFAAHRHLVDFISTLPVDSYRSNSDGTTTPMGSLPPLLRSQNDLGRPGLKQWIGQAIYGMVRDGNAVGWIVETDGFGFPTVVRWLNRNHWNYDENSGQWYVGGQPVLASNLLHIPWIVPPGCTLGLAPIEEAGAMVRAGLSAQEYADIKRGGGLPPAHLKNNRLQLDFEQAARLRDRAVSAFASGKPFVSGSDWDLSIMTIPANHAQFIETMKMSATMIAAVYGIDPREIGGEPAAGSLTYTTDESLSLTRAGNARPYIERFEDAINRAIPNRQYIKLNVDAIIRTDIKTRTEVQDIQIKNGTLLRNEARAQEDRPPLPGGDTFTPPTPAAAPPAQRNGETE